MQDSLWPQFLHPLNSITGLLERPLKKPSSVRLHLPGRLLDHTWSTPCLMLSFSTAHSYGTAALGCVYMGTAAALFKMGKLEGWELFPTPKV